MLAQVQPPGPTIRDGAMGGSRQGGRWGRPPEESAKWPPPATGHNRRAGAIRGQGGKTRCTILFREARRRPPEFEFLMTPFLMTLFPASDDCIHPGGNLPPGCIQAAMASPPALGMGVDSLCARAEHPAGLPDCTLAPVYPEARYGAATTCTQIENATRAVHKCC